LVVFIVSVSISCRPCLMHALQMQSRYRVSVRREPEYEIELKPGDIANIALNSSNSLTASHVPAFQ
jgi:hypothetical protein